MFQILPLVLRAPDVFFKVDGSTGRRIQPTGGQWRRMWRIPQRDFQREGWDCSTSRSSTRRMGTAPQRDLQREGWDLLYSGCRIWRDLACVSIVVRHAACRRLATPGEDVKGSFGAGSLVYFVLHGKLTADGTHLRRCVPARDL